MFRRTVFRACFCIGMACTMLLSLAQDVEARGGRGGGGRGGGISRRGPAQWGSVRRGGASGGYGNSSGSYRGGRSYRGADYRGESRRQTTGSRRYDTGQTDGARSDRTANHPTEGRQRSGGTLEGSKTVDGDTTHREGTIHGPGGETVEYSGSTTRTEDGISRSGSFETSKGASGSGSAEVRIGEDGFEGAERSRHLETAAGETASRTVSSDRDGEWIDREGTIQTSRGVDAETAGTFKRTDGGFVAEGVVAGDDYWAAGQVVRHEGRSYGRGVSTDGDTIRAGRVHCNGRHCHGARVTASVNDYYYYPYYYYPYYYAYYACPAYGTTMVVGYYGTPVYSCSHVVIVSTTITTSSYHPTSSLSSQGSDPGVSVEVKSAPAVTFEIEPGVVVYSTAFEPDHVYSIKEDGRYYWVPGVKKKSKEVKKRIKKAIDSDSPSANGTVLTYEMESDLVYFTDEVPMQGTYTQRSGEFYAWIAGVTQASSNRRDTIARAISAHSNGGSAALELEVRKLQDDRKEPPSADKG